MTTAMNMQTSLNETKCVEGVGNLRIERSNLAFVETCFVKVWRGKAVRPTYNYSFKNVADREKWIESIIANDKANTAAKLAYREARKVQRKQMKTNMKVGTILHYSWGYDQTNCQFYQVTEVRGATVMICEIDSRQVRATGPMSASVMPCKNEFIGKPFRKLINTCGVRMDHGVAVPVDENSEHYESWYG